MFHCSRILCARRVRYCVIAMSLKRKYEEDQEPVEKHDGVFLHPLVMFKPTPHNETFVECRERIMHAVPSDNTLAESYTFSSKGTNFGLMKTSDATISADISLKKDDGTATDNNANVTIINNLLRNMWKTKTLQVNDTLVTTTTSNEHLISHLQTIVREIYDDVKHLAKIRANIPDTAGYFDSVANIGDGGGGLRNRGARNRQLMINRGATVHLIDTLDIVCFNEDGMDRYVPTEFDLKIEFIRNAKTKYLFGSDDPSATTNLHMKNIKIVIPCYKPIGQISEAINKLMAVDDKEAIYYTTYYRLVSRALAQNTTTINENDVFNGSLPVRVYTTIVSQARHNGSHELNAFRFPAPSFTRHAVSVNNAVIQPEFKNRKEAYMEFCRILNRLNRPMPFKYEDYLTDYGLLVNDLTPNKDSFNKVLPNETNGQVNINTTLSAGLGAASQLYIFGEFRNELKIGYKTPPRKLFSM